MTPFYRDSRVALGRPSWFLVCARLDEFRTGEEIGDLEGCRCWPIGPVRTVVLDAGAELATNGRWGGLGGIGRAHHFSPFRNRAFRFENQHQDLTRAHEVGKLAEEWPLAVHSIEALRFGLAQAERLDRQDLELRGVDAAQNLTGYTALHRIGLDNCESTLDCQEGLLVCSIGVIATSCGASISWACQTAGPLRSPGAIELLICREPAPRFRRFRRGFRQCGFPQR